MSLQIYLTITVIALLIIGVLSLYSKKKEPQNFDYQHQIEILKRRVSDIEHKLYRSNEKD